MRRSVAALGACLMLMGLAACSSGDSGSAATGPASANTPPNSATLPADWPTDLPAPQQLALRSANSATVAGRPSTTAVYQGTGDTVTIMNQLAAELKTAGYTETNTVANPPALIVSNWTKNGNRLGVNASSTGGLTLVTMTYAAN